VSIAYSRLFLGVHSLNQCLFGLLLGVWVAFTMEFCVRANLDASVKELVECTDRRLLPYILVNTVAFAGFIVAFVAEYKVVDPKIVNDPEWSTNMVR